MRTTTNQKRIVLLGSTGSIGRQTLEVVELHPNAFKIVGLAAGANYQLFREQVGKFKPDKVHLATPLSAAQRRDIEGVGCRIVDLDEMVQQEGVDLIVVATGGKAGLLPTLLAIRSGKTVALANKEALIMAGELVVAEAEKHGIEILPIDSEHSAIWQCLRGEMQRVPGSLDTIARLILTASGGAFRDRTIEDLAKVTPEEALAHPTWKMGKKITIDSATLMNKGLEVMEARWLYGVPYDRISIVLHRESIIHSMVEFIDGSIKAQLSLPDMRFPIQYALTYPGRLPNNFPRLDLAGTGKLTFDEIDMNRYPCLGLAIEAGKLGKTFPAVLAGADEEAVNMFLARRIGFLDIPRIVEKVLAAHTGVEKPSLEEIMAADDWARAKAVEVVKAR